MRELSKVIAFGPAAERARVIGTTVAGHAINTINSILNRHPLHWITNSIRPQGLVYVPVNLHQGRSEVAEKMYRGCYPFGGISPELGGLSPFDVEPPSPIWERELLSFSWLNDLAAADGEIIKSLARALTHDWIEGQGSGHATAWRPEITSQRLLNWLSNADLLLSGGSKSYSVDFMRSIGRQLHDLEANIHKVPDGPHRLTAACTLILAGLALDGLDGLSKRAIKILDFELNRQILADGGHLSRNPQALTDALGILLPTKLSFAARGLVAPQALITSIDRIFPMVRFFLHGDGGLAGFNGVSSLKVAEIARYFEHDETNGKPFSYAPHSGYHRLEAKKTLIFVDSGSPPPVSVSHNAHAGCLSMELSDGPHRIVVNCGADKDEKSPLSQAARATAAHSAVTINERSSARLLGQGKLARFIGTPIIGADINAGSRRTEGPDGLLLETGHNGYVDRYGIRHERRIYLSDNGQDVRGEDRLRRVKKSRRPLTQNAHDVFTLRFHLHPGVKPTPTQDGRQIFLILPNKTSWIFSILGGEIAIEESIFLIDETGPAKTRQLVIHGSVQKQASVKWSFKKVVPEKTSKAEALAKVEQEVRLPLGDI